MLLHPKQVTLTLNQRMIAEETAELLKSKAKSISPHRSDAAPRIIDYKKKDCFEPKWDSTPNDPD